MTLDQCKVEAQRDANRSGKTMCVINLNTIGAPMYVIRHYMPAVEQGMYAHQFVAKFEPSDTLLARVATWSFGESD